MNGGIWTRLVRNGTAGRFWSTKTGFWPPWFGTAGRWRRSGASCTGTTKRSWTPRCAPPCSRQRPETAGCGAWPSAQVIGQLSPEELAGLKDFLSGQASDGWGEGLEQQAIRVDGGEFYCPPVADRRLEHPDGGGAVRADAGRGEGYEARNNDDDGGNEPWIRSLRYPCATRTKTSM